MIHYYHSKSTVHIWVHAWCFISCRFGQSCNDMYTLLWYHVENFHCPRSPLCLPILLSLNSPIHDLFTISIVLSFPKYQIIGIIQLLAFWDWFLSLSRMYFRFLHVCSWLNAHFLWADTIPSSWCTTVYPFTFWGTSCLIKQVFVWTKFSTTLGKYKEAWLLGSVW